MENKEIIQLNIVTAFLESKVEEELYLCLPQEFGLANNESVILNSNRIELEVSIALKPKPLWANVGRMKVVQHIGIIFHKGYMYTCLQIQSWNIYDPDRSYIKSLG